MKYLVTENKSLNRGTFMMRLEGDTSMFHQPGQFVNISVDGCFLRRPISVCDYDRTSITLVYEIVGRGTERMSRIKVGEEIDMLCGLGNGFTPKKDCSRALLLGGGIGCAPLYGLAKSLLAFGQQPVVILGFNSEDKIVMHDLFQDLGVETFISTADGTKGIKGFVTDAVRQLGIQHDIYYACGPMAMLGAVCKEVPGYGQLSLDVRMACGFGACMCCSIQTVNGPVCVCKDGPVFDNNVLIWQ